MTANFKFELQDWRVAIDLYMQACLIYEKFACGFLDEATKNLHVQRVHEIGPNIRYCAYNLRKGGTNINDLMKMRLSAVG